MTNYTRQETPSIVRGRSFRAARAAGSLDAQIAVMAGLACWWDFHPDRVTAGANQAIANRVAGGAALTEDAGSSGLAIGSGEAPGGGQMMQHGGFNADTVLAGGIFPGAANSVWTKVIVFKMAESADLTARTEYLWRGPAGNSNTHHMYLTRTLIYNRVGISGTFCDVYDRQAEGAWNFAIASWNNATKANKIAVNGTVPPASGLATGTTETQNQTSQYFGGYPTAPSFKGLIGPVLLFSGTSAAVGDLFDASRAADLAIVADYCRAQIGRLSL